MSYSLLVVVNSEPFLERMVSPMGKTIDRNRALRVMGVYLNNVDLGGVSEDTEEWVLQHPQEAGAQFTAFLCNGGRMMIVGDLKIATAPFDPVTFIGEGWKIISEEHDARNDGLTVVDFSTAELVHALEPGEPSIKGEEKLARLKKLSNRIRLGATSFMGLWLDYQAKGQNSVLERLYQTQGIAYVDFMGDVLLSPVGCRYVLYLCRFDGGSWAWDYYWLSDVRVSPGRSAVLAS